MWPFRKSGAHRVRTGAPWWLLHDGVGDAGNALTESTRCDVAIIGAGITGALVADALVATGRRVVVLDAREPAQGSTAASTALLQYEIDTHLVDLVRLVGAEHAALAYRACVASFAMLEERLPEVLPGAGYERHPSLYLAADERGGATLQGELAARRALGIACEWLDADELQRRHGIHRPGAILSALGAQVNPLRLTRALLSACRRHGVRVFSRSAVTCIETDGPQLRLRIANGMGVTADHAVVCAGYESRDFLPCEVADVNNTFAFVTEPFEAGSSATQLPLVWESARPYLYMRSTSDGRLIVGGEDVPFRSTSARDALLPRQIARLSSKYRRLFGADPPPIARAWAGSFAETRDGLPFIGPVPGEDPRIHFALCYGGNGITYSVHAGEVIRAGIEGRTHELAGVFGFGRLAAGMTEQPREVAER
jgi:glycine/D-amino acid oxidase-like deaminating enzyme